MTGNHIAVGATRFLREPFDERSCIGNLASRLRERLTLLGGHQAGKILTVLKHQLAPAAQHRGTLVSTVFTPFRKRPIGRRDSRERLRFSQQRHRTKLLTRGRIMHRKACSPGHPLAVDIGELAQQIRTAQCKPRSLRRHLHGLIECASGALR